jgi:hypothetical protein
LRHAPAAAALSKEELAARMPRREPAWKLFLRFFNTQQRTLVIKGMLKIVHRLKLLSHRTDALSSRMLATLREQYGG